MSEFTEAAAVQCAVGDLKSAIDQRSEREEIVRALDAVQTRLGALSVPTEAMEAELPRAQLSLTPSIPESGFESPIAQRLVVSFGSEDAPAYVGLALFRRTEGGDSARPHRQDADRSISDA